MSRHLEVGEWIIKTEALRGGPDSCSCRVAVLPLEERARVSEDDAERAAAGTTAALLR
ncbi:hypothetical protein [Streptomyces lunalinharesii]|uniref:hypothetical protein n=1 Tax=Streptomyces lunalinharesii TaxID=333384 RepID=UPI0031D26254